jgi:ABC-type phosphate transport system, periplasmic component
VAESGEGPFVEPSRASVADRSYPLARPVYAYYTIDDEKTEIADPRVAPKVREFLRYVLSRQGQQAVAHEGVYLPLMPAVATEQRQRIDSTEIPPERKLLKDED